MIITNLADHIVPLPTDFLVQQPSSLSLRGASGGLGLDPSAAIFPKTGAETSNGHSSQNSTSDYFGTKEALKVRMKSACKD